MQILSIVFLQAPVSGDATAGEMHFVFVVKNCIVVVVRVRMEAIGISVRSRIRVGMMSVQRKSLIG